MSGYNWNGNYIDVNGEMIVMNEYRYHTNSRNTALYTQPHYTNDYFKTPRIVFGKEAKGLNTAYDDRMQSWDYEKYNQSWNEAKNSDVVFRSADFYEKFLSLYFGKKIKLICVWSGFNVSNGYPYSCFGWEE